MNKKHLATAIEFIGAVVFLALIAALAVAMFAM